VYGQEQMRIIKEPLKKREIKLIIKSNKIINLISKLDNKTNLKGFVLLGIIFVTSNVDESTLNHEKIHVKQQLETLFIIFYLIYLLQYLILRLKYDHFTSYKKICFEKEAFENENNKDYLRKRKLFSWIKYI
jgi:hypothetical protein